LVTDASGRQEGTKGGSRIGCDRFAEGSDFDVTWNSIWNRDCRVLTLAASMIRISVTQQIDAFPVSWLMLTFKTSSLPIYW